MLVKLQRSGPQRVAVKFNAANRAEQGLSPLVGAWHRPHLIIAIMQEAPQVETLEEVCLRAKISRYRIDVTD